MNSFSSIIIELFRLPVSSCVSFSRLQFSRNWSISFKLLSLCL